MRFVSLVACIAGLLLAVRLIFFGAERRRQQPGALPLRRSEPALIAFLLMFGVSGYLLADHATISAPAATIAALLLGAAWAAAVGRIAIAMARVTPELDPEDPRFVLQGHVAVVADGIPAGGVGRITYVDDAGPRSAPARSIDDQPIGAGLEVCIERVEDGVAVVERWSLVEARL